MCVCYSSPGKAVAERDLQQQSEDRVQNKEEAVKRMSPDKEAQVTYGGLNMCLG